MHRSEEFARVRIALTNACLNVAYDAALQARPHLYLLLTVRLINTAINHQ